LQQPMLDLILLFYNRDDLTPAVLIDGLTPVLDTLYEWRLKGILSAKTLLNFIIDTVVQVVQEVRNKLLYRAVYIFEITSFDIITDQDSAPSAGHGSDKMKVKRYCECPV